MEDPSALAPFLIRLDFFDPNKNGIGKIFVPAKERVSIFDAQRVLNEHEQLAQQVVASSQAPVGSVQVQLLEKVDNRWRAYR